MAEQFSNAIKRRCGIVSSSTGGSIGIKTNLITGISTVDVAVNDLVDNEWFLAGSKVTAIAPIVMSVNKPPGPLDCTAQEP